MITHRHSCCLTFSENMCTWYFSNIMDGNISVCCPRARLLFYHDNPIVDPQRVFYARSHCGHLSKAFVTTNNKTLVFMRQNICFSRLWRVGTFYHVDVGWVNRWKEEPNVYRVGWWRRQRGICKDPQYFGGISIFWVDDSAVWTAGCRPEKSNACWTWWQGRKHETLPKMARAISYLSKLIIWIDTIATVYNLADIQKPRWLLARRKKHCSSVDDSRYPWPMFCKLHHSRRRRWHLVLLVLRVH